MKKKIERQSLNFEKQKIDLYEEFEKQKQEWELKFKKEKNITMRNIRALANKPNRKERLEIEKLTKDLKKAKDEKKQV